MTTWGIVNFIVSTILGAMLAYQILFIFVGLFFKKKYKETDRQHEYAILIAGRNEEAVIGQLIDSIHKQNYDQSKIKIFVVADNCDASDKTAEIARNMGAVVYERHDLENIGKSFALNFLFSNMSRDFPDYVPDGYFVFDADNLLDGNYVKEMNKVFDSGEKIITSYRASKNYGNSLFSMGSSVGFVRECRFVHNSRSIFNLSTHVSGTGFLFSSEVLNVKNGWNYGKLTEDLEFSCDHLLKGHKVAYCDNAIFYDEQPATFKQTYKQRLRWQKGTYQCFGTFALSLFAKMLRKFNFAFYDFLMFFFPWPVLSSSWAVVNGVVATVTSIINIFSGAPILAELAILAFALLKFFAVLYFGFFVYGSLAVVKDWKRIHDSTTKKILSMFAYPLFMMALIPIAFIAIFKNVEWLPIKHQESKNIEEIISSQQKEKGTK